MDPEHCQLFLCSDAQCCLILAGGFSRLFGCRSGEAWPGGASLQQCARATETQRHAGQSTYLSTYFLPLSKSIAVPCMLFRYTSKEVAYGTFLRTVSNRTVSMFWFP